MMLEADGIFRVDFGTILVTPSHIMHAVVVQDKMAPGRRPVLTIGEAATKARSGMVTVGAAQETISVTLALAIVTRGKAARIIGNVFMAFTKNPYPTKLFSDEDDARNWLRQFL